MSLILVALQPGGSGRAFRSAGLLDELALPADRLYLCGPGDAPLRIVYKHYARRDERLNLLEQNLS